MGLIGEPIDQHPFRALARQQTESAEVGGKPDRVSSIDVAIREIELKLRPIFLTKAMSPLTPVIVNVYFPKGIPASFRGKSPKVRSSNVSKQNPVASFLFVRSPQTTKEIVSQDGNALATFAFDA